MSDEVVAMPDAIRAGQIERAFLKAHPRCESMSEYKFGGFLVGMYCTLHRCGPQGCLDDCDGNHR